MAFKSHSIEKNGVGRRVPPFCRLDTRCLTLLCAKSIGSLRVVTVAHSCDCSGGSPHLHAIGSAILYCKFTRGTLFTDVNKAPLSLDAVLL